MTIKPISCPSWSELVTLENRLRSWIHSRGLFDGTFKQKTLQIMETGTQEEQKAFLVGLEDYILAAQVICELAAAHFYHMEEAKDIKDSIKRNNLRKIRIQMEIADLIAAKYKDHYAAFKDEFEAMRDDVSKRIWRMPGGKPFCHDTKHLSHDQVQQYINKLDNFLAYAQPTLKHNNKNIEEVRELWKLLIEYDAQRAGK